MRTEQKPKLAAAVLLFAVFVGNVHACSTPVYQYALSRWMPDAYEAVIFHEAPLTEAQKALADRFEQPLSEEIPPANVFARTIDVKSDMGEEAKALYEKLEAPPLPVIALLFPVMSGIREPVCVEPLTEAAVDAILDSPVRRKVAANILKAHVATWVILESGDEDKDRAAETRLRTELDAVEKALEETDAAEDPTIEDDPWDPKPMRPERYEFSIIRMPRGLPEERVLESMLMKSEQDLETYAKGPIVFPIFGPGRLLFALADEGINEENIAGTCWFVSGPCACEVKAQNPGMDLLIGADWQLALEGLSEIEDPEPVLTSVMPMPTSTVEDVEATTSGVGASPDGASGAGVVRGRGVVRFLLPVFMLGLLLAVAVGTVVIIRRVGGSD